LKIPLGVPASQAGNDARDDDEVPRLPGEAIEPDRDIVPGAADSPKGGPRRPRRRA